MKEEKYIVHSLVSKATLSSLQENVRMKIYVWRYIGDGGAALDKVTEKY